MTETISQMFLHLTASYPNDSFLLPKKGGRYAPISTGEFRERVEHPALGLKNLGVAARDKIVLLAENSPDRITADYAILCLGGITVPIYMSLLPEQVKYIINDSDAKAVITSSRELREKAEAVRPDRSSPFFLPLFCHAASFRLSQLFLKTIIEEGI